MIKQAHTSENQPMSTFPLKIDHNDSQPQLAGGENMLPKHLIEESTVQKLFPVAFKIVADDSSDSSSDDEIDLENDNDQIKATIPLNFSKVDRSLNDSNLSGEHFHRSRLQLY